jgi:DNA-binding transcriptional ArsR family regulator
MANQSERRDAVFAALADPTRRAIVETLTRGEATVGTLAAPHEMALPSISKHIKVLERAGLVTRRVDGRQHWLRLVPDGFRSAAEWFTHYQQFWTQSIDRLEKLVAELAEGDE